jgi:hypothetical protein
MMSHSRHRAIAGALALVVLLASVAVASTGSVPAGTGRTRSPSDRVLDVAISLFVSWMVVGTILIVILMILRKDLLAEALVARKRRPRRNALVGLLLGFGILAALIRWAWTDGGRGHRVLDRFQPGSHRTGLGVSDALPGYEPEFATGPVLVVLAVIAIGAVAWTIAFRARRRELEPLPDSLIPALTDLLEETLDDLRAEADPRRAVIGAYVRMERALAAYGLPRSPAEAPDEYLQRVLDTVAVSRPSISRLTSLFEWAKFSGRDVAPSMKQEAIEALEGVLHELRAAVSPVVRRRPTTAAALRGRT